MKKISLAYFGTPSFSAVLLEKILTDEELKKMIAVKLVVTQTDKPVGRKQILTPSPVKEIAKKYKIPIMTTGGRRGKVPTNAQERILSNDYKGNQRMKNVPADFKTSSDLSEHLWEGNFRQDPLLKTDLALVLAFGQIIPKELLRQPKYGFWNIHYSLLPKYRGASPTAYALIAGEKKTGVTIIQMDEKIDHGPIMAQEELEILPDDRRPDLEKKLTELAFAMFKKEIRRVRDWKIKKNKQSISTNLYQSLLISQNHSLATYTRLLKKSDGFIPLTTLKKALNNQPLTYEELPEVLKEIRNSKFEIRNSPKIIHNLFRGLYPWPGIWTLIPARDASPRIAGGHVNPPSKISENPSTKRLKIIDMEYQNGQLTILRVQLEGKKEVDFETFNRAYKVF